MTKSPLNTNTVVHIGILVRDIEKSSQDFADFLGLDKPSWVLSGSRAEAQTEYLGSPSEARAKLAFLPVGNSLQIELIEPDSEPSIWRDNLDKYGEGIHHLAFEINGMKQKVMLMEQNDMKLVQKGEYPGGRYAYCDTKETLKTIVELLEND